MTNTKYVNLTQLITILGARLPRVPSAHRVYKAIDRGMPCVIDAASGLRMFDPEAVLDWWIQPADRIAS